MVHVLEIRHWGWGAVILGINEDPIYLNGGENDTTNRMELTAAIEAIIYNLNIEDLEIYTDSKYLKDGIENGLLMKQNGWETANKKPVKNKDLWIKLDNEISKHNIKWNWVKGHANNQYNEKADELARKYIEERL